MGVIGCTPDQVFGQVEFQPAIVTEPRHDLDNLGHDFRADPVAGKNKK